METIKIRYLDPAEDSNVTENSYLALDLNENDKKNNSEELNPRITVKATVSQISKSIFGGSPPFKRRPDGGVEIGIGDIALDEDGNPLVPQPPVVIKQGGAEKIVINDEGIFLKDNTTFEKNVTIKGGLNVEGNSTFTTLSASAVNADLGMFKTLNVSGSADFLGQTTFGIGPVKYNNEEVLALNYDASNNGKVLKIVNGELSWEEDLNPTIPDLSNFIEKNDNISELNNDSGYITASDIPPTAAPYAHPNHSGDVTSVGDGATTITDGAVTNSKIANNAITANKISNNAINENHIAPGSITSDKISNTVVIGGGGGVELRKFTVHNSTTLKIDCAETEALTYIGGAAYININYISIVYAVGGQPRYHRTLWTFNGRTKKLRHSGGTYTLTTSNIMIGRENDSYGINARYDSGVLYIETSGNSYTSSQFDGGNSDNNFIDTNFLVIDA